MKYRIVVETELSGTKWYYVQRKFFLFWTYATQITDMSMIAYRIGFNSLEEAEDYINIDKEFREKRKLRKIIKREYIKI